MPVIVMAIKLATTLRHFALYKNIVHKKLAFPLGSASYSSAPGRRNLWEVQYRHDGREDTIGYKDKDSTTKNDFFLKWSLFLQRDIDFSLRGIKNWLYNVQGDAEVYRQRYIAQRVEVLGPELAAAHFVVYRGGAVKFYNVQKWIRKETGKPYDEDLPKQFVSGVMVEALDASDMNLLYSALTHFEILQRLKWLSFRNNKNVDDWFLDRLAFCKDTLEYLDISGCPNVTERGAMSLHRFRSLKVLKLGNLPGVKHPQLLVILLEEVLPDCKVEGVEIDLDKFLPSEESPSETLQIDQPDKVERVVP